MTPCVLWCCETWALTVAELHELKTTQRTMLRKFAAPRRAPDDTWVSWVRRATQIAGKEAHAAGLEPWVEKHLATKWTWAGHISRMGASRWARRLTEWRDSAWWSDQPRGGSAYCQIDGRAYATRPVRSRAGAGARWEDVLRKYAVSASLGQWKSAAQDRDAWSQHRHHFVNWAKR